VSGHGINRPPEKCPVDSQSYNAIPHNADGPAERVTRASRFFPSSAQFIFLFFVASGFISDAAGRAAQKVARRLRWSGRRIYDRASSLLLLPLRLRRGRLSTNIKN